MSEQTIYTCNNCTEEMDETSFSYTLKSCDECSDKTRTYRLNVKDYLEEYNKTYLENS